MIINSVTKDYDFEKLYYETIKNFNYFIKKAFNVNEQSELHDLTRLIINLFEKIKEIDNFQLNQQLIKRLTFYIAESYHSKTSLLCKYFLYHYLNTEISSLDHELITSFLKSFPLLFYNKSTIQGLSLDDILNQDNRLKENGTLLSHYTSIYQYNLNLTIKYVKQLSRQRQRILITDQMFLWIPNYFELHHKSISSLMEEDGYLPPNVRVYIAIMAVSTIRCEYLLRTLEEIYILQGGDENWILKGLNSTPEKIQNIAKLNNIIAHMPWKLDLSMIQDIYKFENSSHNISKWNFNELVHACLIMVKFHKLASIYQAFGIRLSDNTNTSICDEKIEIMGLDEKKDLEKIYSNLEKNDEEKEENSKDLESLKEIHKEENHSNNSNKPISDENLKKESIFDKHISNFCTIHQDFDFYKEHTLSYIEFNWVDQGYDILKKFYSEGIDSINEELEYIINLTSNSIGESQVKLKTFPMKIAFCTYIEKLYGFIQNDYDYFKVNQYLTRNHKTFFKNLVCSPNNINYNIIDMIKMTFSTEEFLHVSLISYFVKIRLQLTYLSERIYKLWKSLN